MRPVLRAVAPPVAALFALLLPLAGPPLAGAAWAPPCAAAALLVALAVVATTGRPGLGVAGRGLREGTVTAETGVAAAVLAALGWSAAVLAVAAVSPAGPDAVPADPLAGPVLLPGAAAVLTVVAAAVQRTGRPADGDADEVRAGLRTVADRWSALLTPPAALAAVAVTAFAAGTGTPWPVAVPAGIAVLVGACPVPLLAALPAALRAADRAGGDTVRLPSPLPGRREPVGWTGPAGGPGLVGRVDTVALAGPDVLTGTGPGTVTVHAGRGEDPALVVRLAASVAAGARPGSDLRVAARALADAVDGPVPDVAEADEQPGLGVSGLVAELREPGPGDGGTTATVVAHAVLLGGPDWLAEHGIRVPPPLSVQRERAVAEGRAVLVVAWDGCARAVLALPRAPHPAARPGVTELAAAGVAPVLLTPDDDGAARALAAASGLDPADPDAVRPGLDAAARAAAVAGLRVRGRTVAVAADPATDEAALAAADLAVELVPWPAADGAGPGAADGPDDGPDARPDPVVVPAPGSERICARGGPAEVAAALLIARRARAQVRAYVRAAVVLAVAGVVLAVLGTPAVVVAAVPVLGALGLAARGPHRRS
ncbi:HAD family hydrolase [Pseudonocardia alni]|uniref:Cu+-exporting ATPase n=1 Tax=Pseudonocardia alni TaxID=33907 RepID=A0AA44ZR36_PSEA5|nr:HAD family hydrolase [Pseudonocardia alni]PKB32601.1 Cu+-exporting ATPase [Pseudonocardia alni]